MKRSAKASKMGFSLLNLFGMKKTRSKRTRRRHSHRKGKTCRMRGG